MKRLFLPVLILACVGFIGYVVYSLRTTTDSFGDPYNSVPEGSAMVISMRQDGQTWSDLLSAFDQDSDGWIMKWYHACQSVAQPGNSMMDAWRRNGLLCGRTETGLLWASFGLRGDSSAVVAEQIITSACPNMKFENRVFKSASIFSSGGDGAIHWLVDDDVLFVSTSAALAEEVVLSSSSDKNLSDARTFASTDAAVNFFFRLSPGEWMQVDPATIQQETVLSGYAILSDSTAHRLQTIGDGAAADFVAAIPSTVTTLELFAWPDAGSGWQARSAYFADKPASVYWNQAWKDLGDSCQCDLNEALLQWQTGACGSAVMPMSDSTAFSFLFFPVSDSSDVTSMMGALLKPVESKPGIWEVVYPQVFERNNLSSLLVTANFLAKKNETVFVAESVADLETILASDNYFISGDAWKRTSYNLHPGTSFLLYQRDELAGLLPAGTLPATWYGQGLFTEARRYKPNLYRIDMHLANGAVVLPEDEAPVAEPTDTLAVSTNTSAIAGPFEVINHQSRAKETVVQQHDLSLVLVGADGKPLWKRTLDSKIVGELFQVDALKNGKLQMVFCTEKALYVVDRKGNDLDGFPLALPSDVAGSVAVFDYDNNRTYRILVPCEDGKLYNYNLQAKHTEGWQLPVIDHGVVRVMHWKTLGEDRLLAIDSEGGLHVLKRNGQLLFTASVRLDKRELLLPMSIGAVNSKDDSILSVTGEDGSNRTITLRKK
ncbi:MAG: hypothetical protein JNM00_12090 [Flavobacteriales bacterium]|nr:hypothetical protein [Flavobacteriales bacterium]